MVNLQACRFPSDVFFRVQAPVCSSHNFQQDRGIETLDNNNELLLLLIIEPSHQCQSWVHVSSYIISRWST